MASEEIEEALRLAARQEQFLEVVDRDEAEARFRRHLTLAPLGREVVALSSALGRVLAEDVVADVDVPAFDRSSVDGFAIRAADVVGASDEGPHLLRLNPEILTPGVEPRGTVEPGTATIVATGGMLPRGADAIVMVEYTDAREERGASLIEVSRPVAPGDSVAAAGSDIARGETVLRAGQVLTSREIGSLAAIGVAEVAVWLRPRVAIFSTGDEIVASGQPLPRGGVYDSNAAILAAAVEEVGGTSIALGIAPDDDAALSALLTEALAYDVALLSGGTSKGAGDVASRVVGRLRDPGIVVHGVALKPGKPICLAVTGGKPVVILPGFPTSAIFTFHEFVAPVLRAFAGLPPERRETLPAVLATRIASQRGRTEYVMVSLVESPGGGLAAYPTGKGSGAVTAFGQADGFLSVKAHAESLAAGTPIDVTLIGGRHRPADLVVMGSHCIGLDVLIFLASGLGKLASWHGTVAYAGTKGVPQILLAGATALEILGALSLLAGWKSRWGAAALVVFLVPVTLVFHDFWAYQGAEAQLQTVHFLKNVAIGGGLLAVLGAGPGAFSLDARRSRRAERPVTHSAEAGPIAPAAQKPAKLQVGVA